MFKNLSIGTTAMLTGVMYTVITGCFIYSTVLVAEIVKAFEAAK